MDQPLSGTRNGSTSVGYARCQLQQPINKIYARQFMLQYLCTATNRYQRRKCEFAFQSICFGNIHKKFYKLFDSNDQEDWSNRSSDICFEQKISSGTNQDITPIFTVSLLVLFNTLKHK